MEKSILRGRIIDVRQEKNVYLVVVAIGAGLHSVQLADGVALPKKGDIIELTPQAGAYSISQNFGGVMEGVWDGAGDPMLWRMPGSASGITRMERLALRGEAIRSIREYFYREGYLEAQVPLMIRRTCPDAFLDSFVVEPPGHEGAGAERQFLTTSTEYQIKRMWVGGFDRVYTLGQNFRDEPADATHNPEFTMLEWGRTFATLDDIERDVERFTAAAWQVVRERLPDLEDASVAVVNGHRVQIVGEPWLRMSLRDALAKYAGVEVDAEWSFASLERGVAAAGIVVPENLIGDRGLLISFLLDFIQPKLGTEIPTFIHEWPSFQTSSAALAEGSTSLTTRAELFIGGIEIANGFPAMRDYAGQVAGFAAQNARRHEMGKPEIADDEKYLEAMRLGLPPAAGMALGLDRLMMVLLGASHIREVMAYTWDEK